MAVGTSWGDGRSERRCLIAGQILDRSRRSEFDEQAGLEFHRAVLQLSEPPFAQGGFNASPLIRCGADDVHVLHAAAGVDDNPDWNGRKRSNCWRVDPRQQGFREPPMWFTYWIASSAAPFVGAAELVEAKHQLGQQIRTAGRDVETHEMTADLSGQRAAKQ